VRAPEKPAAPAKPKPAAPPAKPAAKRKLSFKEKHALETLPGEIEALAAEIDRLHAALADPGLYRQSPDDFAKKSKALAAAESKRTAAEERWLELEILKEELEG
jgi:ATP-binding cassette subfamily F protein uup